MLSFRGDGSFDAVSTHSCTAFCKASEVAAFGTDSRAGGVAGLAAACGADAGFAVAFCKASAGGTDAAFCKAGGATGAAFEAEEVEGNSGHAKSSC